MAMRPSALALPVLLAGLVGASACGLVSGLDSLNVEDASSVDGSQVDAAVDSPTGDGGEGDASSIDSASDCKSPKGPFTNDSGPYCPFQGDGSVNGDCVTFDHCCIYSDDASTPSVCAASNVTCGNNVVADYQCNETNDCPNATTTPPKCCLTAGAVALASGCTYYEGKNVTGTTCTSSGMPCMTQLCGSNADCSPGFTCTPFVTRGIWLGFCLN